MRCRRCMIGLDNESVGKCDLCASIPDAHIRRVLDFIEENNFAVESRETAFLVMLAVMTLSEVCKMREEQRMADGSLQEQVATLTGDVTTLAATEQKFEDTISAEIATLKASPAAADPAVATAISNIEAITAKMAAATAAAAPPVVVPPVTTGTTGV